MDAVATAILKWNAGISGISYDITASLLASVPSNHGVLSTVLHFIRNLLTGGHLQNALIFWRVDFYQKPAYYKG